MLDVDVERQAEHFLMYPAWVPDLAYLSFVAGMSDRPKCQFGQKTDAFGPLSQNCRGSPHRACFASGTIRLRQVLPTGVECSDSDF